MHRTNICDIERGTRNTSLEVIEKIAFALDTDLPSLFSHGNPRFGQTAQHSDDFPEDWTVSRIRFRFVRGPIRA